MPKKVQSSKAELEAFPRVSDAGRVLARQAALACQLREAIKQCDWASAASWAPPQLDGEAEAQRRARQAREDQQQHDHESRDQECQFCRDRHAGRPRCRGSLGLSEFDSVPVDVDGILPCLIEGESSTLKVA